MGFEGSMDLPTEEKKKKHFFYVNFKIAFLNKLLRNTFSSDFLRNAKLIFTFSIFLHAYKVTQTAIFSKSAER